MINKLATSLIVIAFVILSGCARQDEGQKSSLKDASVISNATAKRLEEVRAADRVEIYLFHETQRCATCIAIGKFAGEMINERYQGEIRAGKIEFAEINIDLPENKELATKFQAGGSALYINAIRNEVDDIKQDTRVWRLTGDEVAFKDYLKERIDGLLGI